MTIIDIRQLEFSFKNRDSFALKIDELNIQKGSSIFFEGKSGCGKTTLLNIMAGLIAPTSGTIEVLNTDIRRLSRSKMNQFRAIHYGVVFQTGHLIPYLNAIENISVACQFDNERKRKALIHSASIEEEAKRLANELDIIEVNKKVSELSVGQQQRVGIARAMMGRPEIILADEPTSALDDENAAQFFDLLFQECQLYDATLIVVSHDRRIKERFSHVYNVESWSHQMEYS